jgi:hypothetical protein
MTAMAPQCRLARKFHVKPDSCGRQPPEPGAGSREPGMFHVKQGRRLRRRFQSSRRPSFAKLGALVSRPSIAPHRTSRPNPRLRRCPDIGRWLYPQAVRNAVEKTAARPVSRETNRWIKSRPGTYPQGPQAVYVGFHVKGGCLWITSVDNFGRAAMPTDRDVPRRGRGCLNG